jgi:hypothetical protein
MVWSCFSSGMARLPAEGIACANAGKSKSSARHEDAIVAAAAAETSPALACARARAASKSRMAWTAAASVKRGSTEGERKKPSRSGMPRV